MWVRTGNIISYHYSISRYYSVAVILITLLYLITEKICLWEIDQVNSNSSPDNNFFYLFTQQSRATRQPSQLNGENYRVMHMLFRGTPPPPELNLFFWLILKVKIFVVDLARSPTREQWYYCLIELEVKVLKILEKFGRSIWKYQQYQVHHFHWWFGQLHCLREVGW